jgi:hypothetical protein
MTESRWRAFTLHVCVRRTVRQIPHRNTVTTPLKILSSLNTLESSIHRRAAMWKFIGVVIAALLLGMVSPFMAANDDGLILRTWFQWLPIQVDLLVLPGSELMMLGLAMVVLAAQYLVVFLVVMQLRPLLRRLARALLKPLRQGLFVH